MKKSAAVAALEALRIEEHEKASVASTNAYITEGRVKGVELALERVKALDTLTDKTPDKTGKEETK